MPLDDHGRYAAQDIFRYELAKGLAGKQGGGALAWTGARSIYRSEPKVGVQIEQTGLARPIFSEPEPAAAMVEKPREVA